MATSKKSAPKKKAAATRAEQRNRRGPQPELDVDQVKALTKSYKALIRTAQSQLDRAVALMAACESQGKPIVIRPATSYIEPTLLKVVKQTAWFESMATTATREKGIDPASID